MKICIGLLLWCYGVSAAAGPAVAAGVNINPGPPLPPPPPTPLTADEQDAYLEQRLAAEKKFIRWLERDVPDFEIKTLTKKCDVMAMVNKMLGEDRRQVLVGFGKAFNTRIKSGLRSTIQSYLLPRNDPTVAPTGMKWDAWALSQLGPYASREDFMREFRVRAARVLFKEIRRRVTETYPNMTRDHVRSVTQLSAFQEAMTSGERFYTTEDMSELNKSVVIDNTLDVELIGSLHRCFEKELARFGYELAPKRVQNIWRGRGRTIWLDGFSYKYDECGHPSALKSIGIQKLQPRGINRTLQRLGCNTVRSRIIAGVSLSHILLSLVTRRNGLALILRLLARLITLRSRYTHVVLRFVAGLCSRWLQITGRD